MNAAFQRLRGALFAPLLAGLLALASGAVGWAQAMPETLPEAMPAAPPSISAQRIYANARAQLVQVRTLLQGDHSQATVGSGFLVDASGLLMTNYHVISNAALEPRRHRLVYTTASGEEGPLEVIAFDVVHDLALLRAAGDAFDGAAPLRFRPQDEPLEHGERLFSLGNPLDVGFAVMEGHYNGLVERTFYPNIFFGGSLSSGMSGGPALDAQGRVIGVNVATRRDGEQISFLVPGEFAERLLAQSAQAAPLAPEQAYPEITRQLLAHQERLTERFIALPWQAAQESGYAAPTPQEVFMRCWGRSSPEDTKGMRTRLSDCSMDTAIFISNRSLLHGIQVRHRWLDGSQLGPWGFAQQYSDLFGGQLGPGSSRRGDRAPRRCHERFVQSNGLPMRAVVCVDAYQKLKGLYALDVLVASVNQTEHGLQSRLRVAGVSFANAMRLTEHFLKGFAWKG